MKTLDDFRAGVIPVVVATDVAGRGIHVYGIDLVINFDVPHEPESYVHRIGRTGRAGASGRSYTFACEEEAFSLPDIETFLGRSLQYSHPSDELLTPLPPSKHPFNRNRPHRSSPQPRFAGRRPGGTGRSRPPTSRPRR
jgi:ATP-dependent RNA helicase RhlB